MPVKRGTFAARRKTVGFSQEQLAERLKVDRSTVARWESGETEPHPWIRPRLARALEVSAEQLDELLGETKAAGSGTEHKRPSYIRPAGELQLARLGNDSLHDPDAAALQAFRAADLQVGGGHLYASVIKYLHTDVAPRLFGTDDSTGNGAIFTAAGALTEMAAFLFADLVSA